MRIRALFGTIATGVLVLSGCAAGKGSFAAPQPTPTYLSGTPGTVALVTPGSSNSSSKPGGNAPVIQAGTPVPLSTVGERTTPSAAFTPQQLRPASNETPLPLSCGGTNAQGTPLPSAQAAATPEPSANGPIIGQPAPGPYTPNGSVTITAGLSVPIQAFDTSFKPNTIFVTPGEHVHLDINNGAGISHDFCSPALGINNPIRIDRPRVPEQTLTNVVEFNAPQQPGVYMFWSNAEGQAQKGMTGEVVVRASS